MLPLKPRSAASTTTKPLNHPHNFLIFTPMKKRFNITGVCFPEQHYMADSSAKYAHMLEMIEQGDYFTINRPRQYGKTTALFQLEGILNKTTIYLVLRMSFESLGESAFKDEQSFCQVFLDELRFRAGLNTEWSFLSQALEKLQPADLTFKTLSRYLSQVIQTLPRKLVLMIDEVDKSSNNQLFLHFLGMLRDKYLERNQQPTFHSVILTGVHDVKTLKLKLRPDEERKYNSPWNIAADFDVDMNFSPAEIQPMLQAYAQDTQIPVDTTPVAERLFYYTSGYPFLVSKLCKIVAEKLLPTQVQPHWTTAEVDEAAHRLVRESNVNFDELIKNLENNPALYQLALALVINEQDFPFDLNEPVTNLGVIYGIFTNRNGLAIHNRIYQEVIASYMSTKLLVQNQGQFPTSEFAGSYLLPGQRLNVSKALLKFQELMKAEYNKKERDFLERQGRLVFLAFLKPILNGHGHAFKEPQISEEKRLDILITYYQHQYVIELKLWRGQQAHENGLNQLADYLDRLGLQEGALLIFDHQEQKQWKSEEITWNGKRIFAVWS